MNSRKIVNQIYAFYLDGFRRMTLGRSLWKIIIIKLVIIFFILKIFFFPNYLKNNFDTDAARADHVINEITTRQVHSQ